MRLSIHDAVELWDALDAPVLVLDSTGHWLRYRSTSGWMVFYSPLQATPSAPIHLRHSRFGDPPDHRS